MIHQIDQPLFGGDVGIPDVAPGDADGIAEAEVVAPPAANEPIEQLGERRRHPGRGVHAVGDGIDFIAGEHPARHFAVAHRHSVDVVAEVEGEVGHVQGTLVTALMPQL
jgi:hypothetical protein